MSNQLNDKLYQFEETPPIKNWEAISSALYQHSTPFADKLYHYQQTPDTGIWNGIEQKLNSDNDGAVVLPFYKRFSQPLKYVGAAAILILVATVITLFLNQDAVSNEVALQPGIKQSQSRPVESGSKKNDLPLNTIVQNGDEETNKKDVSDLNQLPASNQKETIRAKLSRYVTMADDEGKKVRLSKKAFTVFNCAENSASLNYVRCKENIELMQQKMSASMLSPSGDFGGLIDMLKSLEEND